MVLFPPLTSLHQPIYCNHQDILNGSDLAIRAALEGILGSPLSNPQWLQASLSTSQGGLGFRLASSHGSAAFLASVSALLPLVQEIHQVQVQEITLVEDASLPTTPTPTLLPSLRAAMEDLQSRLGDPLTHEEVNNSSQKKLSALVDATAACRLLEETEAVREKARLKCVGREGAGDWLGALPSKSHGLHLRRLEFVAAVK